MARKEVVHNPTELSGIPENTPVAEVPKEELSEVMLVAKMMEALVPVIHDLGKGVEKFKTTQPPTEAPPELDKAVAAIYTRMPQPLQAECLVLAGIWKEPEFRLPSDLESALNQFNDCVDLLNSMVSKERQFIYKPKAVGYGVAVETPKSSYTPKEAMMKIVSSLHREYDAASKDLAVRLYENGDDVKVAFTVAGKDHFTVHRSNVVDYLRPREVELKLEALQGRQ
jgi:hypothetical protein